jgi:hypothetical protein
VVERSLKIVTLVELFEKNCMKLIVRIGMRGWACAGGGRNCMKKCKLHWHRLEGLTIVSKFGLA